MSNELQLSAAELSEVALTYGLDIVGAVAILVIGWIAAGWAGRWVVRVANRSSRIDATLKPLFGSIVRYAILVFTVIAVLARFGVETTSIIAVLGAAGLAIGLALQGTLSNIAAGVMLLFLRPLKVGEYVDAEGTAGTVVQIGMFTTELCTFDGVYLSVPNAQLWNRTIKNFSRLPTRRIDVPVGVSYGDDVDKAMTVLKQLLATDDRVLDEPAAEVMVTGLADSAVIVNMRCWTEAANYWALLFHLNRSAKLALDTAGITIPFPQRDVHLKAAPHAATAPQQPTPTATAGV